MGQIVGGLGELLDIAGGVIRGDQLAAVGKGDRIGESPIGDRDPDHTADERIFMSLRPPCMRGWPLSKSRRQT
jgi:hypothetical protein